MGTYFGDATFDAQNRSLFAFAAYNAGPANIARVRTKKDSSADDDP
jgi:membrane-bound lytic murein transglycosylase MltF